MLLTKQKEFTQLVARFIWELQDLGYEVTFGYAYRDPAVAAEMKALGKGISNSLHCQRLAIDLNLFKDGKYLQNPEDYAQAGRLWEAYSRDGLECCWGGRFKSVDAVHFSIAHEGRK